MIMKLVSVLELLDVPKSCQCAANSSSLECFIGGCFALLIIIFLGFASIPVVLDMLDDWFFRLSTR